MILLKIAAWSALVYAVTHILWHWYERYRVRKGNRLRALIDMQRQFDRDQDRAAMQRLIERSKEENGMAKMYRQGDVLLVAVKSIPEYAKELKDDGRVVLAYGEVTGHAHAFYPEVAEAEKDDPKAKPKMKAVLWDAGAERFLRVVEKTALRHEEHTAIEIPKGNYRVVRQREYDPERDRWVAD